MLGLTFNHQSNGRSDPLSRSWNRVMLNLGFERNNFALMLRPWYRFEEDLPDDNNPDIVDYVGRGDLTAFYRWKDHDFSLMLRHTLKAVMTVVVQRNLTGHSRSVVVCVDIFSCLMATVKA